MTTNLIIQYSIVGAILLAAVVWIIVKAVKNARHKGSNSGCCGCTLSDHCTSPDRHKPDKPCCK